MGRLGFIHRQPIEMSSTYFQLFSLLLACSSFEFSGISFGNQVLGTAVLHLCTVRFAQRSDYISLFLIVCVI